MRTEWPSRKSLEKRALNMESSVCHGCLLHLEAYINWLDDIIWGRYFIVILLAVGIYYSIRLKFPQVLMAKYALSVITEKDHGAKGNKSHISPYEALMISMGTRVGIGTIVGMAVAVVQGGPGVIVWMWLAAFLNGAISVAENTLGQVYKSRDGDGFKGGAPYYLAKGLGARKLAIVSSALMILTGWSFSVLFSYTIYTSFEPWVPEAAAGASHLSLYVGAGIVVFASIMFFGGGRYIARFTSYVTPFMSVGFILIALYSIAIHWDKAGRILGQILDSAFDVGSILGGFAGSVLVIGIKRAMFANEAGLGSVPGAAAAAHTSHPVKQGIVQAFCVFVDTLIASLSVLFVLFSDSYGNALTDADGQRLTALPLVQSAMRESLGVFGNYYMTFLIVVLTATVLVGSYYIGQMNLKYISDKRLTVNAYRIVTIGVLFIGAQASLDLAWNTANVVMGLCASINIVAVFLLFKVVKVSVDDFLNQKRQGINPTFSARKLGIENAECWD
ncbi:sodium:alanine symporter family protein [Achromobacter sp. 2789STDY5608621]|uniref:alanine/glycine:cation symporter family protein n=1 Tax=Achromobacter sp. 2789STDY5608621 TaxID=1806496 RepID=UPI0018D0ABBD|nr:alanine/glycine:cation symporter family protein [Achromobacter sp. 2789STDY5608621]